MTDKQYAPLLRRPSAVPPEIAGAPGIPTPAKTSEEGMALAPGPQPFTDSHRDFAAFHQSYVWNAISLADTKAAWSFAVCAGMLAYLVGRDQTRDLLAGASGALLALATGFTLGLLSAGAAFAFLVIVPRLATSAESLVFFGAVAKRTSASEYVRDVGAATDDVLTRARLVHAYDISRISGRKYANLRKSMWFALAGLATAGLLQVLTWGDGAPNNPRLEAPRNAIPHTFTTSSPGPARSTPPSVGPSEETRPAGRLTGGPPSPPVQPSTAPTKS